MRKSLLSSAFAVWAVFVVVGVFLLWSKRAPLRFGIDLVGGNYVTLDVKVEEAVKADLVERLQILTKSFKRYKVPAPVSSKIEEGKLLVSFANLTDSQAAAKVIKAALPDFVREQKGENFKISFSPKIEEQIKHTAVESVRDVLEKRLNKSGVSEVTVVTKGKRNIVVELPNVQDPEKAKAMIGTSAMLEFKLVENKAPTEEALLEETDGEVPEGMVVVPGKLESGIHGANRMYYLLPAYSDLTGRLLLNAYAGFGGAQQSNQAVVHFEFSSVGAERFGEMTSQNYGKTLAVVVDGEVISDPQISDPIYGGRGYIHGSFTWESAKELGMMLKTGAFVAPVSFIEERTVKPTLGEESIRQGVMSCLVGLFLLFLFSLYYYKIAGLFAFIALLFNMLLILLGLSWLRATLTLPGIAGMVLTVGMAIDASILIYERIKEELLHPNNSFKGAVAEGFSGAIVVILDANITTFIVGAVLYSFGTGPVQGFAVTTMLGIVATLLTGLFFLRSLFDFAIDKLHYERVKI